MVLVLKPDASPSGAIQMVLQLANQADSDRYSGSSGPIDRARQWVSLADNTLRNYFTIRSVMEFLSTDRYTQLQGMEPNNPLNVGTLFDELTSQADLLREEAQELEILVKRLVAAPGSVVVPDTCALLRMNSFVTLDWPSLVDGQQTRVVLPLRIVEELDQHKYGNNDEFRKVARRLLRKLDALLEVEGTFAGVVSDKTTVEILVPPGRRQRSQDADQEILDVAIKLKQFIGQPVRLLTLDSSMRARAKLSGLLPMRPPDSFLNGTEARWEAEADDEAPS
jgi:PIN domain